jgi:hypothetical protein
MLPMKIFQSYSRCSESEILEVEHRKFHLISLQVTLMLPELWKPLCKRKWNSNWQEYPKVAEGYLAKWEDQQNHCLVNHVKKVMENGDSCSLTSLH